jgi:hypothetical protein
VSFRRFLKARTRIQQEEDVHDKSEQRQVLRLNPLSDKLFAVAALSQDGSSTDIDWAYTREEADAKRLSYLTIAATLKFPGTYQGILSSLLNWLETANGRRMDGVAATNLETVLDVTFEIERLVAEAGLRWEKTISRADVHQIAARLISDNVAVGSKNVSVETIARASLAYATISNDVLQEGVEPFVAARVQSGQFDIRSAHLLQRFYEAVRDTADARYGDPELASEEGYGIVGEFVRETSYIERLDPDLLAKAAEKSVAWRAYKAGLTEERELALPAA